MFMPENGEMSDQVKDIGREGYFKTPGPNTRAGEFHGPSTPPPLMGGGEA